MVEPKAPVMHNVAGAFARLAPLALARPHHAPAWVIVALLGVCAFMLFELARIVPTLFLEAPVSLVLRALSRVLPLSLPLPDT